MPSVCTVSTTGHAAACPDGAAGDQHRELTDEVHPLLGEQALGEQTLSCAACRATTSSQSSASSAEATTRTPLPS